MDDFERYLEKLAGYEEEKAKEVLKSPRDKILVYAGVHLNWLGDFLGNPDIKWVKKKISVNNIEFSGMSPEANEILLKKCERSAEKLKELIKEDSLLKEKLEKEFLSEEIRGDPILIRIRPDTGKYTVLDGMHRFVGMVLRDVKKVEAYLPINEEGKLPHCEPHVVYDLIRGFRRNADDEKGEEGLYQSLLFLTRIYGNVKDLLRTRFSRKWVHSERASDIFEKLLRE